VAGDGTRGYKGDGGQATSASLNYLTGVAVDAAGNVYIADTDNNRIRLVTKSTGIITTVAGDGGEGYQGDGGLATSTSLRHPEDVALDASGNIYIADTGNDRIRLVTKSTGIITTVVGTGGQGFVGDGGLATLAALNYPSGVELDASENIYIADTINYRVRMVTKSNGIITTVAGGGMMKGNLGDGGLATLAALSAFNSVAVDASGNIYIAETNSNLIRLVTKSTGIITTVAGDGQQGYNGDGGPATSALLWYPHAVDVDKSGNVYIADSGNNRIRLVTKSTGIITTVAGGGTQGYLGVDGLATTAQLTVPSGIFVDEAGKIYISDFYGSRVMLVTPK
jgi:trimeric autotransporter adhesin